MQDPKSLNKRRVNAYCLASIKVVGLVYTRRQEKRDRKAMGINIGFLSCDRVQKV